MATNCVVAVHNLATAATHKGHALHGVTQTPAQWATAAGYPGNKASSMRQHMARQSGNGCGRSNRYGAVTAAGMVQLLALGHAYSKATTAGNAKAAAASAQRTKGMLAKAKAGKAAAQRTKRTGKAPAAPATTPGSPSARAFAGNVGGHKLVPTASAPTAPAATVPSA